MQKSEHPIASDRRRVPRILEEPSPILFICTPSGDSVLAEICDVSPDGIGILIDCGSDFDRGCRIVIEYQGTRIQGTVVNVVPVEGRARLGVQVDKNEREKMTERRNVSRLKPDHNPQVVLAWDDSEVSYRADVYDISPGGIGIIIDDRLCLQIGCLLKVEYQEIQLLATALNICPTQDGFRVGLRWERLAPFRHQSDASPASVETASREQEIVVGLASEDLLYMKQGDGDQQSIITVSRGQLIEVIEFLSNPQSSTLVASCDLAESVTVQASMSDRQFTLVQGDSQISGVGDLRQLICPELTTNG